MHELFFSKREKYPYKQKNELHLLLATLSPSSYNIILKNSVSLFVWKYYTKILASMKFVKRNITYSVGFFSYDRFVIILSQKQKICQFHEQNFLKYWKNIYEKDFKE